MILARRLAECHFRSGLVLPLRQNVAPFHLDRLAQPPRRLAGFRQRQQLGAAQPYIMPLAVALQSQEPRGSAALVHFQKQPFTVLISARIRQSCRSEEHTSELQSLMRISYAVFCLKKKNNINSINHN